MLSSWLVGGGWEAQAQTTVEKVQHSSIFFFYQQALQGLDGMWGPKMNTSPWQLRPHPPLPGPVGRGDSLPSVDALLQ